MFQRFRMPILVATLLVVVPASGDLSGLPVDEITWGGVDPGNPQATGSPFINSPQVGMTPIVVNLNDDNGDMVIDDLDYPEIVFVSYATNATLNGILRAIHGGGPDKGADYFASCGSIVWQEGDSLSIGCTNADAALNPRAGIAAGDLDGDGIPEIVAMTETGGIQIIDNTGNPVSTSAVIENVIAPTLSIANVDNTGFAELVFSNKVITLEHDGMGNLQVLDVFSGTLATGASAGARVSCVANIHGDTRQEIVAGTTLYEFPRPPAGVTSQAGCTGLESDPEEVRYCNGELNVVWDAAAINSLTLTEGVCAIADVLGADLVAAPGPANPPDGVPEIILVESGTITILDAAGTLRRSIVVETAGGAPAISDTDGDGFPEIATQFNTVFAITDLQDPSVACPPWPAVLMDGFPNGNPSRTPPGIACTQDTDCNSVTAGTVCHEPSGTCICEHNGWLRGIENGSGINGSSGAFDFDGDDSVEVVVRDECRIRWYAGREGDVEFSEPAEARGRIGYAVVADVDRDGNAEVVFSTNNESGFCSEGLSAQYNNGIEVWGENINGWAPVLETWNQYSYDADGIDYDNSIPLLDEASWNTHNTYRTNITSRPTDLAVVLSDDVDPVFVGSPVTYSSTVTNEGSLRAAGTLTITLPVELQFSGATVGCSESIGVVSCPFAGLDPGGMVAFDVDALGLSNGQAIVTAVASGPADPDPADNTAVETTDLISRAAGDRVWMDLDGDGIQDGGEPGVPNVLVAIYDGVTGVPITASFTGPTGLYEFTGLILGNDYFLRFTPPVDSALTLVDQGGDDALDSDADPITLRTATFTLTDFDDPTKWDAGMIPFCIPPDEPLYIYNMTVTTDGNDYPVIHYQDANQPSQITGYNVYRSSDPGIPIGSWPLVASDVIDMDDAEPNKQWIDSSGDVSPSGVWYYQLAAYNSRCPAEGPF